MVSGNDCNAISWQTQVIFVGELLQEFAHGPEFGGHPPLRQVTGDHQHIRTELVLFLQGLQVLPEPRQQRVVRIGQTG